MRYQLFAVDILFSAFSKVTTQTVKLAVGWDNWSQGQMQWSKNIMHDMFIFVSREYLEGLIFNIYAEDMGDLESKR